MPGSEEETHLPVAEYVRCCRGGSLAKQVPPRKRLLARAARSFGQSRLHTGKVPDALVNAQKLEDDDDDDDNSDDVKDVVHTLTSHRSYAARANISPRSETLLQTAQGIATGIGLPSCPNDPPATGGVARMLRCDDAMTANQPEFLSVKPQWFDIAPAVAFPDFFKD